jgi:hypothetical protein
MEVRRAYQLEVIVRGKPGALGQVLQSLATGGADLRGVCTYNQGDRGVIQIIPHDLDRAEAALRTAGYASTRKEVVVVEGEDKPGIVADLGRRLGRAGVNIEFLYATGTPGGKFLAAFNTADIKAAFDVLQD